MRNDLPPPPTKEELRAHAKSCAERLDEKSSNLRNLMEKAAFARIALNEMDMEIMAMEEEVFRLGDERDDAEAEAFAHGVMSEEAEYEAAADKADARRDCGHI